MRSKRSRGINRSRSRQSVVQTGGGEMKTWKTKAGLTVIEIEGKYGESIRISESLNKPPNLSIDIWGEDNGTYLNRYQVESLANILKTWCRTGELPDLSEETQ